MPRMKKIELGKRLRVNPDYEVILRFMSKIELVPCETILYEQCWQWKARIDENGYGRFFYDNRNIGAHRFAYATFVNCIPATWDIDHKCGSRSCCNPAHLIRKPRAVHNKESGKKRHECDAPF